MENIRYFLLLSICTDVFISITFDLHLVGETFVSDFICSNVSTIDAEAPSRMLLSKSSGQQQPAGNVEFIAGTGIEWRVFDL